MADLFNKSTWSPLDFLDDEVLSVSTTSTPLTGVNRAKAAVIQVQVAPVRSRIGSGHPNGTDPTATVGKLWNVGDSLIVFGNDLNTIEFISANGQTATLFVEYVA